MSRPYLSLALFCLGIAVCSSGVLPRISNELQNDVLNLEDAPVSESRMFQDGSRDNIDPKSTNSSLDVSELEVSKMKVLNVTNVSADLDDANADNNDTNKRGTDNLSPIKVSNDSGSQINELKGVEDSKLDTTNSTLMNSTSLKVFNDTEETNRALNENLNETFDSTQESKSEVALPTEAIEDGQGQEKNAITETLNASLSLIPNETMEFEDTKNLSSMKELEILLNETEAFDTFNDTEFIEESELTFNLSGENDELLGNLNAVLKPDNSLDFKNETTAFERREMFFDKHNESSFMLTNETRVDTLSGWGSEDQNASFPVFSSNSTGNLSSISSEDNPDIDSGNFTSLESLNSKPVHDLGEVNISESHELESDSFTLNVTEVSSVHTEMMSDDVNKSVKNDVENTPIEDSSSLTNEKESEGLFSNFGLDFLKDFQIAKNAAKAMEIFNLSDSITDHIIEENEFHSFLGAAPISADSVDSIVPPPPEKIDLSIFSKENSSEGLKNLEETNLNTSEDKTSLNNEVLDIEGVTLLKDAAVQSDRDNSLFNLTDNGAEDKTEGNFQLTSESTIGFNDTFEIANSSESTTGFNDTFKIANSSESATGTNGTLSLGITNSSTAISDANPSAASPKCPPPGVCIFWFLAQDTCAVNSHCLGSRICCRTRCSKTCIEV